MTKLIGQNMGQIEILKMWRKARRGGVGSRDLETSVTPISASQYALSNSKHDSGHYIRWVV